MQSHRNKDARVFASALSPDFVRGRIMLARRLRHIPTDTRTIMLHGEATEVPAFLADSVEEHWTDVVRFNKRDRQEWVPLLLIGFTGFNELVNFDYSKIAFDEYQTALQKLGEEIEAELDALQKKINSCTGSKQGALRQALSSNSGGKNQKLDYTKDQSISFDNLKDLINTELKEFVRLNALHKKIHQRLKELQAADSVKRSEIEAQLKTNGRVSNRDDVDSDSAAFDYATHPAYTHPAAAQFTNVSTAHLDFVLNDIFSDSGNGSGLGLNSILQTSGTLLARQGHTFATPLTRRTNFDFGSLLDVKAQEVRSAEQGLAQSAYERLNRDLLDETSLPLSTYKLLSKYVADHGNFVTYTIDRDDLSDAIAFARKKVKEHSSPWFGIFRPNAVAEYRKDKAILEMTLHDLEAQQYNFRGLIDAAKGQAGHELNVLLTEFNKGHHALNLTLDNLLHKEENGEFKNLNSFIEFLGEKALALNNAIEKHGLFKSIGRRLSGKHSQDKKQLAMLRELQAATKVASDEAKVATDNGENYASVTNRISIVVDSPLTQTFLEDYNSERVESGKTPLHTGSSMQLMEQHVFYHPQDKVKKERKAIIKSQEFNLLLQHYNKFRETRHKAKIELVSESSDYVNKANALSQIHRNGDFSEFMKVQQTSNALERSHLRGPERSEREAQDQRTHEFNMRVQQNFSYVHDRFLELLIRYNEFRQRCEPKGKPIDVSTIFTLPTGENKVTKLKARAADREARERAYDQLKHNGDFVEFIAAYKSQLAGADIKDVSERSRQFMHYVEAVDRDLDKPGRLLSERLQERIQDSYERFSDLVVYHGVNDFTIRQAVRYLTIMQHTIEQWADAGAKGEAPINIPGVDLTNKGERDKLLHGFEIARKIINGEDLADYLIQSSFKLTSEAKAALNKILKEDIFDDTGYAGVERLLVPRYSRIHLSHQFSRSASTQSQLDVGASLVDGGIKAPVEQLINVISNNTILDVETQYAELASDARSFFARLLFINGNEDQPRLICKRMVPVINAGGDENVDDIEKYLHTRSDAAIDREFLKHNLGFKQQAEKKVGEEVCELEGGVVYRWTVPTMTQLLSRLQFNSDLSKGFRVSVKLYLQRLNEAAAVPSTDPDKLTLDALQKYAIVYSTIFTAPELQDVSKVMFSMIFNPELTRLSMPEEIETFIKDNNSNINAELNTAITNFIDSTTHPFDYVNLGVIFAYANLDNIRAYALKKFSKLLNDAKQSSNSHSLDVKKSANEFVDYLTRKNDGAAFTFSDADMERVFALYAARPPEAVDADEADDDEADDEVAMQEIKRLQVLECAWRESVDRLACYYYKSDAGNEFIIQGRLAHLHYLLNNHDVIYQLESIKKFRNYLSEIESVTKRSLPFSQDSIDKLFTSFIAETYQAIPEAEKPNRLHYLNKAESLAFYFDGSGKWLDAIRLLKIEAILDNTVDLAASDFIAEIKSSKPYLEYPKTAKGRADFELSLRRRFVNSKGDATIKNKYVYTGSDLHGPLEALAIEFDTNGQVLDQLRLSSITEVLRTEDMHWAQTYVAHIERVNGPHGQAFPCLDETKEELQQLFLAFIYPSGTAEEVDMAERYAHSTALQFMINKYGTSDVKEKCIIARIALIFNAVATEPDLAESLINRYDAEGLKDFANKLSEKNLEELNRVLAYHVDSPIHWSSATESLIKAFEPASNKGKFLKAYRFKRLVEIFNGEGCDFTKEEYLEYQRMLGTDQTASVTNLKQAFGASDEAMEHVARLCSGYVKNLLERRGLRDDKQISLKEYELDLLKQSEVFNLAILLFSEVAFGKHQVPNKAPFNTIILEGEDTACAGKYYYDVWTPLLREFNFVDRVKKRVEEVADDLKHGGYRKAQKTYATIGRYGLSLRADEYPKAQAGMVAAAVEHVKEQVGYVRELTQLQEQIQQIAKSVMSARDTVQLRQQVSALLAVFVENVPDIASPHLRGGLLRLQEREANGRRNLISTRGSVESANGAEVLELLRLLPLDESRQGAVDEIREWYDLFAAADESDLEALKGKSEQVAARLQNLLKSASDKAMNRALKRNIGANLSVGIEIFSDTTVECVVDVYERSTEVKHAITEILGVLKSDIGEAYAEFIALLPEIEETRLNSILESAYTNKAFDRPKVPAVLTELLRFLHEELISQRLMPIRDFHKADTASIISELSELGTRDKVSGLINQLAPILNLQAEDSAELIAALTMFKKKSTEEYPFTIAKLKELLSGIVSADGNQAYVTAITALVEKLSYARAQQKFNKMAEDTMLANSSKDIAALFQRESDEQESRAVKAIVAELLNVDEIAFMKANVVEMQEVFVSELPKEAHDEVNYVTMHEAEINAAHSEFIALLDAKKDGKFTANLGAFDVGRFPFLLKGLDKKRLVDLVEQLDEMIQAEKTEGTTPYTAYLTQVRHYLKGKAMLSDVSEAKTALASHAKNLITFLQQLDYLLGDEPCYSSFAFDKAHEAFTEILPKLSSMDKGIILSKLSNNKNDANNDLFKSLTAYLNGEPVELSTWSAVSQRFKSFAAVMNAFQTDVRTTTAYPSVSKEQMDAVTAEKEASSNETESTIALMHAVIRDALHGVITTGKTEYNFHTAFRAVAEQLGTDEQRDKMLFLSFETLLLVIIHTKQAYIHAEYDCNVDFLTEEELEELRYIIEHYREGANLEDVIHTRIDSIQHQMCGTALGITKYVQHAKELVTGFGTEEQKERFALVSWLAQYTKAKDTNTELFGLYQLRKTIEEHKFFADYKDIAEEMFTQVQVKVDSQAAMAASRSLAMIVGINFDDMTEKSLDAFIPTLLMPSLFNFFNSDLKASNGMIQDVYILNKVIDNIATLYLYIQTLQGSEVEEQAPAMADKLLQLFIDAYIALRNNHENLRQSVPCSTAYAQALIARLASPEQKHRVRVAEEGFARALEAAKIRARELNVITRSANRCAEYLVEFLGLPNLIFNADKLKVVLQEVNIKEEDIGSFVTAFNQKLGASHSEHKLETRWDGEMTLKTLQVKLFHLFKTAVSQELQARRKYDEPAGEDCDYRLTFGSPTITARQ